MNEFVKKMLEFGAELDQAASGIECNTIIYDAEKLYNEHMSNFKCACKSYSIKTVCLNVTIAENE